MNLYNMSDTSILQDEQLPNDLRARYSQRGKASSTCCHGFIIIILFFFLSSPRPHLTSPPPPPLSSLVLPHLSFIVQRGLTALFRF